MVPGHVSHPARVVVVGGGVGGLVAAIDLAGVGFRVTLLEKGAATGGKMRVVSVAGLEVDAGPTVLTMKWVFDELFRDHGRSLSHYVETERAEILARHTWLDGASVDLHADPAKTEAEIDRAFGREEATRYAAFARAARRTYELVEAPFVRAQRPTVGRLLGHATAIGLRSLGQVDAHRSMWRALERHFRDPHLIQLFARYATYCGSSPFEAAATLNLVAHVESLGVHRVRGGMGALARGLERLADDLGVEIECGADVEHVEVVGGRVRGVHTRDGRSFEASAVVLNGDVSALGDGLFGEAVRAHAGARRTPRGSRSLSAVTWAVVGATSGGRLVHHNVFFSSDYRAEFEALARGEVPAEPTVYICAQDRGDAPAEIERERLLILVNAPATGDDPGRWQEPERRRCEQAMRSVVSRCGLELDVWASDQQTPAEQGKLYPGTGGALYGPRSRGPFSPLTRATARTRLSGLYLAGGSVHPGPGVPMAALSGRRAAALIREDLGSTATSYRGAISGTTSTGKATTVAGPS